MQRLWSSLVSPICDIVEPRIIVEVGLRAGIESELVLEYCRDHGIFCHLIDPVPPWNLDRIKRLVAEHGRFHELTSLEALPGLEADLFLLDGDHNWFTVHRELETIRDTASQLGRPFPVVCLHDVGWPYGRRDLYYEPSRIPASDRRPHAKRGIQIGRSELALRGGFNHLHSNAITEGGPRNGVLTAVEDFVAETSESLNVTVVPGFHGLGVIWSEAALDSERARQLEHFLELPAHWKEHLTSLERARLEVVVELREYHRLTGGPPAPMLSLFVRAVQRLTGMFQRQSAATADGGTTVQTSDDRGIGALDQPGS